MVGAAEARTAALGRGDATMPDEVTVAGKAWVPDELAAVVVAARAVFRSCQTVDDRLLWALGEAVDGPHERREWAEAARGEDGAEAA